MSNFTDYILPFIVAMIVGFGAIKGLNVFDVFLDGAKSGFKTVLAITPALIGLIVAVNMLKSSGGLDVISNIFEPVCSFLKIPKEITPLAILSPISGSGTISMFETILKEYGPDSFVGRCATIIMGSTETTLYTIAVYTSAIKVKKTRFVLITALLADFVGMLTSVIFWRIMS